MIIRLLPSYEKALHWMAAWKILDQLSTYLASSYSPLHLIELNLFINLLAEVTGFNAALVLIGPLQIGFLYVLHRWNPIVTEAISLMLPFIVLGNTLTLVGEGPHLAAFGMTLGVIIGYTVGRRF